MNSLFLRVIGSAIFAILGPLQYQWSIFLEVLAQSAGDATAFTVSRAPGGPFDSEYNAACVPSGPFQQIYQGTLMPPNPAIPTRFTFTDTAVPQGRWCWQVTQQETPGFTDAAVSNIDGINLFVVPAAPSGLRVVIQ